ncbi:mCG148298 [Mus musculus]|nr:mCG148298 [Mus musculus]
MVSFTSSFIYSDNIELDYILYHIFCLELGMNTQGSQSKAVLALPSLHAVKCGLQQLSRLVTRGKDYVTQSSRAFWEPSGCAVFQPCSVRSQ